MLLFVIVFFWEVQSEWRGQLHKNNRKKLLVNYKNLLTKKLKYLKTNETKIFF